MKKHLVGLDVLRGIGIFGVVGLHSAFYYYDGLFTLDLANPPPVVTVIGLLLMFAGLFAVISGLVHTLQWENRREANRPPAEILRHQLTAGLFLLAVAYLYFLFTGPGLSDFTRQTFDNSVLVDLIRHSARSGISRDRLLYVDSLVMLGLNALLGALVAWAVSRRVRSPLRLAGVYLGLGLAFFLVSLVRIPLYDRYLAALAAGRWPEVLALNWLVNKNNPIFPYLAFGIMGMWLGALIRHGDPRRLLRRVLPVALPLLTAGIAAYVILPDTMLERSIDGKWYAIMLAQLGLFTLITAGFVHWYDVRGDGRGPVGLSRFFARFGVAGLTVFFWESVVSAAVYRVIRLIYPGVAFSINQSLLYGFALALLWGVGLIAWEKRRYRYGLEYAYAQAVGRSTKGARLGGYPWA